MVNWQQKTIGDFQEERSVDKMPGLKLEIPQSETCFFVAKQFEPHDHLGLEYLCPEFHWNKYSSC